MATTLKKFIKTYKPNNKDEEKFIDKHTISVDIDGEGNGDDVFKATNVKTYDRRKNRHGYNPGEDADVCETFKNYDVEFEKGQKVKVVRGDHTGTRGVVVSKHDGGGVYAIKKEDGKIMKFHISNLDEEMVEGFKDEVNNHYSINSIKNAYNSSPVEAKKIIKKYNSKAEVLRAEKDAEQVRQGKVWSGDPERAKSIRQYAVVKSRIHRAITNEETLDEGVEQIDERNKENKIKKDIYVTKKGVDGFIPKTPSRKGGIDRNFYAQEVGNQQGHTTEYTKKELVKGWKRVGRNKLRREDVINNTLNKYLKVDQCESLSIEERIINYTSYLGESYVVTILNLFESLDEDNKIYFMDLIRSKEGVNRLLDLALSQGDE